jgi:hypothetical protein
MKKIAYIGVCLVILCIPGFSDSFFDYYEGNPHMIGITIVPLGYYSYYVARTNANFDGGFREIGVSYEYRLFIRIGFEAYGDFKGYCYEDYQLSSHPLVRVWGLPSFKIGAGGVYHVFDNSKIADLSFSLGIEYAHYIADVPYK